MEICFHKLSYSVKASKSPSTSADRGKSGFLGINLGRKGNQVKDGKVIEEKGNSDRKRILTDISGQVGKGKMLAILGSSGCGKSSLLDCLSGRVKVSSETTVTGRIFIDGSKEIPYAELRHQNSRKSVSGLANNFGYVMQDDAFLPHLTVRETLTYAYALKLRTSLSKVPFDFITSIIKKLGLSHAANTRVGSQLIRGISGGERRRLSIGVELVTNPRLLFLDEPTSGLDSVNAIRVVEVLKTLCRDEQCTIMMSIHQPSSSLFHLFDDLMILDQGKLVYFGKAGEAAIVYFGQLGFPCPNYMNPAEFLLDVVLRRDDEVLAAAEIQKIDEEKSIGNEIVRKVDFAMEFSKSESYKVLMEAMRKQTGLEDLDESQPAANNPSVTTEKNPMLLVNYLERMITLLSRTWTDTRRNGSVMYVRTFAALLIALLVGAIFFQVPDTPSGSGNRINSLLFLMCVFSLFCVPAISKLVEDRVLFYRERDSGSYDTFTYFMATILVEIPILFAIAIGYGSISYWMVGLQPKAGNFIFFLGTIFLVINTGFSLSQAIAAGVKTTNMAIAVYMILLVYSLLLGGFMISKDELPSGAQWLVYTSYFYFGFEALVVNEFELKSYGLDAMKSLNFQDANKYVDLIALAAFFIGWRIVAFILLRYRNLAQ